MLLPNYCEFRSKISSGVQRGPCVGANIAEDLEDVSVDGGDGFQAAQKLIVAPE